MSNSVDCFHYLTWDKTSIKDWLSANKDSIILIDPLHQATCYKRKTLEQLASDTKNLLEVTPKNFAVQIPAPNETYYYAFVSEILEECVNNKRSRIFLLSDPHVWESDINVEIYHVGSISLTKMFGIVETHNEESESTSQEHIDQSLHTHHDVFEHQEKEGPDFPRFFMNIHDGKEMKKNGFVGLYLEAGLYVFRGTRAGGHNIDNVNLVKPLWFSDRDVAEYYSEDPRDCQAFQLIHDVFLIRLDCPENIKKIEDNPYCVFIQMTKKL
jgi:hypothetical protein